MINLLTAYTLTFIPLNSFPPCGITGTYLVLSLVLSTELLKSLEFPGIRMRGASFKEVNLGEPLDSSSKGDGGQKDQAYIRSLEISAPTLPTGGKGLKMKGDHQLPMI